MKLTFETIWGSFKLPQILKLQSVNIIKIIRKPTLNLRNGTIKIYAGQQEVGVLEEYQQEVDIQANEGDTIWAKLQFCSSNKFKVDKGVDKVYLTSFLPNKGFVLILGSMLLFTIIALLTDYIFFGFFPFIVGLYPIYYITFGRNRYLKLSEKNG